MGGHIDPPSPREALRWALLWGAILGALGVFDYWRAGKHDGSTLSEVTRAVFDVDSPNGRRLFTTLFGVGSEVLLAHICKHKLNT